MNASVSITPKLADEWLQHNTSNRKISKNMVDYYAKEMTEGRWVLSDDAIKLNSSGDLIDGQHRLMAIKQANMTVNFCVATGINMRP